MPSSPITARSPQRSASSDSCRFRSPGWRATTSSRSPSDTPWYAGPALARASGDGRGRCRRRAAARLSHAGAMGQSPEPGFSRLHGDDLRRTDPARRRGARAALGQEPRAVARIVTFGGDATGCGGGAIRDAHPDRRGGLQPRRCDLDRGSSSGGRGSIRGDDRVDGGGGASSRPALLAQARHADRDGDHSTARNTR